MTIQNKSIYDFLFFLQMFDWIYSNREVFLSNYVEIGRNHGAAEKLQEDHNQFTLASNVSSSAVQAVIISVGRRCIPAWVDRASQGRSGK